VHWWSGPELLPWSTFFDAKALRSSSIPAIEFEEYKHIVGGNFVDLAVTYKVDMNDGKGEDSATGGKGDFKGWMNEVESCASEGRQLPQYEVLSDGAVNVVYSGHCNDGVTAKRLRCASFKSPWPQTTLDMLSSLDARVDSVLLKHYDFLLSPETKALDAYGLRDSMLFAEDIRKQADTFIATKFVGKPYISAHVRRTDFLRVRTKTTPGADAVAGKLNAVLESKGFDKVFVATDAPEDIRADLRKMVKGEVVFFDEGGLSFDHPGKHAAAEMWIAARADFFIGTQESRFTASIQMERGFLGKPSDSSEHEFCKSFEKEKVGKPCKTPHAERHPQRKGAHRETYH
jgi:peptide-O-fucosyltransferase